MSSCRSAYLLLHYINNSLYSEMRKFFDLEKPEFSDGSQEDTHIPSKQVIDMYNQEYSVLLFETKNFFAQCKDCINRLMTLNNIGFGFNLPFIFTTFMAMEKKALSSNKSYQQLQSSKKKQKYSTGFYDVLFRMSGVIEDLQNIEFQIKKNYLGLNPQKSIKRERKKSFQYQKDSFRHEEFQNIKKKVIQEEEATYVEKQKQIRELLTINMTHNFESNPDIVNFQRSTNENIDKLNNKIEKMKENMKDQREKEQVAWQKFKSKLGSTKSKRQGGNINKKRESFILDGKKEEQWNDQSFNTDNSMRKDSSTFCF